MQSRMKGFTLIELMVVIAVIAILAAIAYPSYIEHIKKTRRSAAGACLMEQAQFMERWYTTYMTYTGGDAAWVNIKTQCKTDISSYYTLTPVVTKSGAGFSVTAAPAGAQSGDACGTLGINEAGTKSVSTSKPVTQCF